MANITTLAVGGNDVSSTGTQLSLVKFELDIAEAVAAGLATTEYVTLLNLPADTYFKLVQAEVVTALSLGSGPSITVGDEDDADEFITADSTLTAGHNYTITKDNHSDGDVVAAASEVRCYVTGGTIASGVIRFTGIIGNSARNAIAEYRTYPN